MVTQAVVKQGSWGQKILFS